MNKHSCYQTWMTIVYNRSFEIVDIINPQHCMLLQLNEDDLLGRYADDLEKMADSSNKEAAAIIVKNVRKAYQEDKNVYFEYTTSHKDGTITFAVCYAEKAPDDLLYINVLKIDEENVFEMHEGFTSYIHDITRNNMSIGVGIRRIEACGTKNYVLFNEVVGEFLECEDILQSQYWNQEEEDAADEQVLQLREPLKIEKVIRDEQGNIHRWLTLTKRKITSKVDGYYIITTMMDITKRRQNEILLEQQFMLLDSMYKNIPLGLIIYDRQGNLLSVNQTNRDIMGIPNDIDLSGINLFEEPHVSEEQKNKLRSGEDISYDLDYHFQLIDNYFETSFAGSKPLHIIISVIKTNGIITGYLLVNQDRSKFFEHELLLEQTATKLATIYNSMSSGIEIYDKDGVLVDCNDYDLNIFGIEDKNDFISKGLTLYNNPNLSPQLIEDLLNGKNIKLNLWYNFDLVKNTQYYQTSRKGRAYLEAKGSPMFINSNELIGYVVEVNDITRVKEQDMQLNELHENLMLALEAGDMSAWIYDIDKKMFFTLYGQALAGEGLSMEKNMQMLHPDDVVLQQQIFESIINGTQYRVEAVFRYKSLDVFGGYRYYESHMLGKKSNGEVVLISGTQKDITDSYIRQMEIEEYNKKIHLIKEVCNIVQWDYDPERRLLISHSSNALYPDIELDFSAHSNKLLSMVHPDDRMKAMEFMNTADKKEADTIHLDVRMLTSQKDSYRYKVYDGIAIRDVGGNIVKYAGIHRDVSEWLEMNAKLTEQNNINNLILRNINSGLVYINLDCKINWSNLDAFPDLVSKMGIKKYTMGHYCDSWHSGACSKQAQCMVKVAIQTKEPQHREYKYGKDLTIDVTSIPVYGDNARIVGALFKMDDITERKRLDNELLAAKEKAEESDKLKSAFLANMSHEIRTPLNAIVGFSELLSEVEYADEKTEYINIIDYNNELLLRLISDILDLSKIESGLMELKYETFDMAIILKEIFASFKQKMTNLNVEFMEDNPYSRCMVTLDKNRLLQVYSNFLTNAMKYTPSGYIKIGYAYENEGLKIYVEDTGIGIALNKHDKVFERFEKLDDFAQGTGLGLSICKAITNAQNGRIGFESTQGKGSTFWAWFPTTAEITEKQIQPLASPSEISIQDCTDEKEVRMDHLNILVVEDNDSNYMLLEVILKQYSLTRAYNGLEAVKLAKKNVYDIILMDMKMPVMDGIEVIRKIREFDRAIIIVAVTANAYDSDRKTAIDAGCNAFVTKPIKRTELLSVINECVNMNMNSNSNFNFN